MAALPSSRKLPCVCGSTWVDFRLHSTPCPATTPVGKDEPLNEPQYVKHARTFDSLPHDNKEPGCDCEARNLAQCFAEEKR